MKLVNQNVKLLFWNESEKSILKKLEHIGRYAYASHDRVIDGSEYKFIKMILKRKHLGILEHQNVTFEIKTNRAIANEFERHRLLSFVQSSTRYIKYDTATVEIIRPPWYDDVPELFDIWSEQIESSLYAYSKLINKGITIEKARGVLSLDLGTELAVTGNLRSWINFLSLRDVKGVHPQMIKLAQMIKANLVEILPTIFGEKE